MVSLGEVGQNRKGLYAFGDTDAGLPGLANEIVAPSYPTPDFGRWVTMG